MSTFTAPSAPTVAGCIREAREVAGQQAYLSQSACVDVLLDCLQASVRRSVRAIIEHQLQILISRGLVTAAEFNDMLDHVQLALQVDAAFDHLEIRS